MAHFVPYCGSPPIPGHVVWNTDPVLGSALALVLVLIVKTGSEERLSKSQMSCLVSGWLLLSLALMSPLCNLSVALFSARAAQHIIIAFVAAPLIALSGAPAAAAQRLRQLLGCPRQSHSGITPALPWIFALVFWFWHMGAPYDLTLKNNAVYWLMQLSIIVSSIGLWHALASEEASHGLGFMSASLFTGFHLSLLGALLTLSGMSWFKAHQLTTWVWGISPLEDQQYGGALMWAAGGILLGGLTIYGLARCLVSLENGLAPSKPGNF